MKTSVETIFKSEPKDNGLNCPLDLHKDIASAGYHLYKADKYLERLSLFCSQVNDSKMISIESDALKLELEELKYCIEEFLPDIKEFIDTLAGNKASILRILKLKEDGEK